MKTPTTVKKRRGIMRKLFGGLVAAVLTLTPTLDLCQWVESDPHGALPELEESAAGAISELRRFDKLLHESS